MALGQASPGPDLFLMTRTALAHGARAGIHTALGIACGLTLHAAVAMGGVSVLLAGDAPLARWLRLAAALYLLWIAWHLLRAARRGAAPAPEGGSAGTHGGGTWVCWRRGFLCNVLNPKVALFLAAVAASFTPAGHPAWWPWLLGLIVVTEGLLLWIAWARALQWPPLKRIYQNSSRWLDAGFAIALVALAARMVA
jgi:threonine efflux protein